MKFQVILVTLTFLYAYYGRDTNEKHTFLLGRLTQADSTINLKINFGKDIPKQERAFYYLTCRSNFLTQDILINAFDSANNSHYTLPVSRSGILDLYGKGPFPVVSISVNPGDSIMLDILKDTVYTRNNRNEIISIYDIKRIVDSIQRDVVARSEFYLAQLLNKQYVQIKKNAYLLKRKEGVGSNAYLLGRDSLFNFLLVQLENEVQIIDSLKTAGLISDSFAQIAEISKKGDKAWIMANLSKQYEDSVRITDFISFGFFHDSLVFEPSGYYRGLLSSDFLTGAILKKRRTQLTKDFFGADYTQAYDLSEKYLTGLNLAYIKYYCLTQIKEGYSNEVYSKFYTRFLEEVDYESIVNYVKENLAPIHKSIDKKDDMLLSVSGEQESFSELTGQGKLLYIDFWASWCQPCREAMPASRVLRKEFENDSIIFAYISIDANKPAWLSANKMEKLDTYTYSFLLGNPKEANLVTRYKINAIPRYILFGKDGKLITADPPSPESDHIRSFLKRHLKN